MEFCECRTQLINNEGYCWGCAQPVRMVEVLLFGKMPFEAIERMIQLRAEQQALAAPRTDEN